MVNPDNTKIRNIYDEIEYHRDGDVRPVEGVKSTKDFKKVLSKRGRDQREEIDESKKKPEKEFNVDDIDENAQGQVAVVDTHKDDEENASAGGPVSLFDLSKSQNTHLEELERRKGAGKAKKVPQTESPQDLFRRMSAKETPDKADTVGQEHKEEGVNRYAREQPDLSYVNPLSNAQQVADVGGIQDTKVGKSEQEGVQLIDLVNQLIKELYSIETKGQKDTVLVLENPPLFKGASVVISAFDTAKGQFNLAFQNLTQEAQRVLDLAENRQLLLSGLAEKGYGVQIFTTSTTADINPLITEEASNQKGDEEERRQEERDKSRKEK